MLRFVAAGLTRYLRARNVVVLEANSTHRATTARRGKDDAIDAEMATREVLSGEASAQAKDTAGSIESIRLTSSAENQPLRLARVRSCRSVKS